MTIEQQRLPCAHTIQVGYCDGLECNALHIWLFDENEKPFATIAMDKTIATIVHDETKKYLAGKTTS